MIAEYDSEGRIFHIIRDPVPPGVEAVMAAEGKLFICHPPPADGAEVECGMDTHYVTGGKLAGRPRAEIAIAAQSGRVIATNIPSGTEVEAFVVTEEGERLSAQAVVNDGELLLDVSSEGRVRLRFIPPWPYQEISHEVDARPSL